MTINSTNWLKCPECKSAHITGAGDTSGNFNWSCQICGKTWRSADAISIIDFAKYPKSVAEVRSNKAEDGRKWTPRDALISMLRRIDSGETNVSQLIIVWAGPGEKPDAELTTGFSQSTTSTLMALGLLQSGIEMLR